MSCHHQFKSSQLGEFAPIDSWADTYRRQPDKPSAYADHDSLAEDQVPKLGGKRSGNEATSETHRSKIHGNVGSELSNAHIDQRRTSHGGRKVGPSNKRKIQITGPLERLVADIV